LERFRGARIRVHAITETIEHAARKLHERFLVVEEQDALAVSVQRLDHLLMFTGHFAIHYRKINIEPGAAAGLTLHCNRPVVVLHDAPHDSKPKARAADSLLRG